MDNYKIYVVNESSSSRDFWCFLDNPIPSTSNEVFANSSVYQNIPRQAGGLNNDFTIPVQYSLQACANNQAVGLDVKVDANQMNNVNLGESWKVGYQPSDHGTPTLTNTQKGFKKNMVEVQTNKFSPGQEERNNWYSALTFGIETAQGFMGVTLSPYPQFTYDFVPHLKFYISTGAFQANTLADVSAVASSSAKITEDSFDSSKQCTVTYTDSGKWKVKPGTTS